MICSSIAGACTLLSRTLRQGLHHHREVVAEEFDFLLQRARGRQHCRQFTTIEAEEGGPALGRREIPDQVAALLLERQAEPVAENPRVQRDKLSGHFGRRVIACCSG